MNSQKQSEHLQHPVAGLFQQKKKSFLLLFRSSILTGFFVLIPIVLSLWMGTYLFSHLTDWAVRWANHSPQFSDYVSPFWTRQLIRLVSLVLLLILLFLIGLLTKITLGRRLIQFTQHILLKLPIINFIYSTCQQIGDAIWSSKDGNMFHQVVLFEYPRRGAWVVGFLTNKNATGCEVTEKLGRQMYSVFLPTTPNPTSGFLMYIPADECILLDMSVSDAMKLIVSCGAVIPGTVPQTHDAAGTETKP